MSGSNALTKIEAFLAATSFVSIFVVVFLGQVAVRFGLQQETATTLVKLTILFLFFVFGFSCIGLMIHVFIVLQTRIGNAATPMVRFMAQHETAVTVFFWCFLGLGLMIALPFALHDLVGLRMPLAPSHGTLVADIGMTIDEARSRSSLKFPEPRHMMDGSWMGVQDMVFDFQIANSSVHFPQSRYYWMVTPKNDRHINTLNIGISPRKMPMPELKAFQHKLQSALRNDGWMPGHYLAKSEQTVVLWGGEHTAGDGRYWARGESLLIFETNRMDERQRDEPKDAGEWILYIHMKPKSEDQRLVFEPSAWKGD